MANAPAGLRMVRVALVLGALAALAACATWPRPAAVSPSPASVIPDTVPVLMAPGESPMPRHWQRGAVMTIDVRTYQDSNGDGVGDIKGLIQRLDYLKDLGVRSLLLMGVTPSADPARDHVTTNFRDVAPEVGTLSDFDELVRQAHARGLGVMLDHALGRSAAQHPTFRRAASGSKDAYRDWYVWSSVAPRAWSIHGRDPWHANGEDAYLGTEGPQSPNLNLRDRRVVHFQAGHLRFWLNRGADGFRFDNVSELVIQGPTQWSDQPASRDLAGYFTDVVHGYSNRQVVCDGGPAPQAYGHQDVCGAAFATDLSEHFVKAVQGVAASVRRLAEYWRQAPAGMATHAQSDVNGLGPRLWDELRGDRAAYKLVASTYLLQPGTPFILYGEEVGQAQAPAAEGVAVRSPMSWAPAGAAGGFTTGKAFRALAPNASDNNVQTQLEDGDSILSHYRTLLQMRQTRPSIERGSFESVVVRGTVLSFQRALDNERTLVVVNYGRQRVDVEVSGLPRRARMAPIFPRRAGSAYVAEVSLADGQGRLSVSVPARTVRVYDVEVRNP